MTSSLNKKPISLILSPLGHLKLEVNEENQEFLTPALVDKVNSFFETSYAVGILRLAAASFPVSTAPSLAFWQSFGQLFLYQARMKMLQRNEQTQEAVQVTIDIEKLQQFCEKAPFMKGGEYVNTNSLTTLAHELSQALHLELKSYKGGLDDYLSAYNAQWQKVGRVCFHLAENKNNHDRPFAFLATYTTNLSDTSKVQHVPLGQALKEYANDQHQLLSLLLPVQRASSKSQFIKNMLERSTLFSPQAWSAQEAYYFLKDVPLIEESGVNVRIPNWWSPQKPPRPQVKISLGNDTSKTMGLDALLDFEMHYALPDGTTLDQDEMQHLLSTPSSFVHIKGQWVEVDQQKLSAVMTHWNDVAALAHTNGLSFAKGMRLIAGSTTLESGKVNLQESVNQWSTIVEGNWLKEKLAQLRSPDASSPDLLMRTLKSTLHATLRPYQVCGVQWLWTLYHLRLGGCLADDMGLGKTIQVLSLLLFIKNQTKPPFCHLLVVPASLLGNWQAEIEKFAPSLRVYIAHSSGNETYITSDDQAPDLTTYDLVITTYGNIYRLAWLETINFDCLICDEAQNLKNPQTKQAQAIKKVKSHIRFILTGTPVENKLLDLWSLFDFILPGLLGSSKEFAAYSKKMKEDTNESKQAFFTSVRHLINPYILRRLKTDKSIISDLPDKTELETYCFLSKQQIAHYQQAVNELAHKLKEARQQQDLMARRGLVLSYLTRFKQICNHPTQWLGHGDFKEDHSGKFIRLKEICENIAAKQEKVLIFTQYYEIMEPIHALLKQVFKQSGLILHGKTPVKKRAQLVETFQQEEGPPFFILSLKAGGTGLTLTHASHVIHFDRWWNPAVENQATDRAYRIGQNKNVLVHKFICQGTIEEKINAMIESKQNLATQLLQGGGDLLLTEMTDEELMNVVCLDIHRALGDT